MTRTHARDAAVKAYSEEMRSDPFELWLEEMKQKGQYWEASSPAWERSNTTNEVQ